LRITITARPIRSFGDRCARRPTQLCAGRSTRRRGSVYVAVLGFSTLMLVAAVSALLVSRVERASIALANDRAQARVLAMSAVDRAFHTIAATRGDGEAWRSQLKELEADPPQRLGAGTSAVELFDAVDGDPADAGDHLWVIGIGVVGDATYRLAIELDENGQRIPGTWTRWTRWTP